MENSRGQVFYFGRQTHPKFVEKWTIVAEQQMTRQSCHNSLTHVRVRVHHLVNYNKNSTMGLPNGTAIFGRMFATSSTMNT